MRILYSFAFIGGSLGRWLAFIPWRSPNRQASSAESWPNKQTNRSTTTLWFASLIFANILRLACPTARSESPLAPSRPAMIDGYRWLMKLVLCECFCLTVDGLNARIVFSTEMPNQSHQSQIFRAPDIDCRPRYTGLSLTCNQTNFMWVQNRSTIEQIESNSRIRNAAARTEQRGPLSRRPAASRARSHGTKSMPTTTGWTSSIRRRRRHYWLVVLSFGCGEQVGSQCIQSVFLTRCFATVDQTIEWEWELENIQTNRTTYDEPLANTTNGSFLFVSPAVNSFHTKCHILDALITLDDCDTWRQFVGVNSDFRCRLICKQTNEQTISKRR